MSRMDAAHATAPPPSALYERSDIGAGPPLTWQLPHLSRTIGKTSSLYVYFDVTPLCASIRLAAIAKAIAANASTVQVGPFRPPIPSRLLLRSICSSQLRDSRR